MFLGRSTNEPVAPRCCSPSLKTDSDLPSFNSILELNIGLICACMPVVTPPLKTVLANVVASWHSIKNYSRTRLFTRSPSKTSNSDNTSDLSTPKKQRQDLPQILKGNGTIPGLQTFIRRAYYSSATSNQQSAPMTSWETNTVATLDSTVNLDYHSQVKAIYSVDAGR